ncbi:hypothetical protein H8S90_15065 [Olivibacter sp. SDN3]|uniref:hypothetical protein n=1 Tax=Olivibacter sp. SDN3 TaxID=2764720 RepID=UPI001651404F|nr:hypothetical protein [Olivibacter sp. SDN3]QNL48125.1 hypothetical protein H8S90_15065 [Olivibacter sp. SDN3]
MAKKDDLLWKGILEEVFDDFLRFMHENADEVYDLNRGVTFLDKELEQLFPPEGEEFSPKVVDKLVQVYSRSGEEEWILVHVEVQGRYHKNFSERMFTYYYRILDKYNRPITAYAIFTDAGKVKRPSSYETEHQGTSIRYRFNTYHIALQDDEDLQANDNPFAMVALTAKMAFAGKGIRGAQARDIALLDLKLQVLRRLVEKKLENKKIRALMNFLKYYVRFENEENLIIFEKQIEEITGRSEIMGIEELLLDRATKQGIQKGERKGERRGEQKKSREFVENLLLEFDFTDEKAAQAAQVSIEFVQKIRAQLNKKKK